MLTDSTVICEYLNEQYPEPSLLPAFPSQRGRACWLEEYADSRLGDVLIWHFYNQVVIKKYVWNQKPDEAVVQKALTEEIPQVLDYLEAQLPEEGFLFGAISTADIAEEVCMTTPIAQQRDALKAAGAPVSEVTAGTSTPRPGVFAV